MSVAADPLAVLDPWTRRTWVPNEPVERIGGDWVMMACEGCGTPFKMTARTYRSYRNGERTGLCSFCKPNLGRQQKLTVTNEHRQFWLERFTIDEILTMATWSWGEVSEWPEGWRDGFTFV